MTLAVSRLVLSAFRNYAQLRLELDSRPVALTGPNGVGKTNILEALSLLAPGSGLRRARIADLRHDKAPPDQGWAVWAHLEDDKDGVEIGIGQDGIADRRKIKIDGKRIRSQTALAEKVNLLWLTPQMDRIFTEGAGGRRRFWDRLTLSLDSAHAERAQIYERALRERARLLREGQTAPEWLDLLEARMVEAGTEMAEARLTTIAQLNLAAEEASSFFPAAFLEAKGTLEEKIAEEGLEKAAQWFRQTLRNLRTEDQNSGGSRIGPHRSDLIVCRKAGLVPAGQCSTGEQKALLIAILLASARLQIKERRPPLLLLDEVAAHLDQTHRAALFDALCALETQSWMTGTDQSLFSPLGERAQFYYIEDGRATPTFS